MKGFAGIFIVIAVVIVLLTAIFVGKNWFNPSSHSSSGKPVEDVTKTNAYLGVLCTSNPNPKFTHDLTESDNILKITPPSLVASKSQDRAFLWIDTGKVDKVPRKISFYSYLII